MTSENVEKGTVLLPRVMGYGSSFVGGGVVGCSSAGAIIFSLLLPPFGEGRFHFRQKREKVWEHARTGNGGTVLALPLPTMRYDDGLYVFLSS